MTFELVHVDKETGARAGILRTPHGDVETPFFMPVATRGTVKTLAPEEIPGDVLIANSFHLSMKPGVEAIKEQGGLHGFMRWNRPIFTDSGGFQIIRENFFRKITDDGLHYVAPDTGERKILTPEAIMDVQEEIGSDIAMVLDDCPPYPSDRKRIEASVRRTALWAERSIEHHRETGGKKLVFAIVQGGLDEGLRRESAKSLTSLDFDGFAIGGLSIGETKEEMSRVTKLTASLLPANRPRYLMGVGSPLELLDSMASGVDIFDSVFPTRNARHGTMYTMAGKYGINSRRNLTEYGPLEDGCGCYTCRNYSRSYVSHLMREKEMLGMRLASIHNLYFIRRIMREAREAILEDRFGRFTEEFTENYLSEDSEETLK